MILAGMGPVDPLKTDSAKLFATFYALYSGVAFLAIMAILTHRCFTDCCTSSTWKSVRMSGKIRTANLESSLRR